MLCRDISFKAFGFCFSIIWIVVCVLLMLPSHLIAQTSELITPIPPDRLAEATAARRAAINRIRQRPTTQSLTLVTINVEALRGESTRLSIPGVSPLTLTKRREETKSTNNFTWYGTLAGIPGHATLVVHNGKVTGSIHTNNELYSIEPITDTVHALIKVDPTRYPPDHDPTFNEVEKHGALQPPPTHREIRNTVVGIDVMVGYTTAAKNAVGDIIGTIQLAVAEANQSYINSNINIRLNLVDQFETTYDETGKTWPTIDMELLADATVQAHRTSSGADLTAVLVNSSGACGRSAAINANATNALSAVQYSCAAGAYSLAHEFGHLMGARHDENHDPLTTPYAYGHGYEHPSSTASQSFRTIMAYPCMPPQSCEPRVQYWSSPNVYYNGIATGTAATNDNVRVLNENAAAVAALNSPPVMPGNAPIISSINPSSGSEDGSTLIDIYGAGFTGAGSMEAHFGTSPNSYVGLKSCESTTHCTLLSPSGTGTVHITIAYLINGAPGPFSAPTAADLFTYQPFPYGDMAPDTGPPGGGTLVNVVGHNFSVVPGATQFGFNFNGVLTPALDVSCSSTTMCTMKSPPLNPPSDQSVVIPVQVTVAGMTSQIGGFTYIPAVDCGGYQGCITACNNCDPSDPNHPHCNCLMCTRGCAARFRGCATGNACQ
jgi:hypothetical protein